MEAGFGSNTRNLFFFVFGYAYTVMSWFVKFSVQDASIFLLLILFVGMYIYHALVVFFIFHETDVKIFLK